jgi:transposase
MRPEEKEIYAREFPVHVGVDTGKTFHVMVARGPDYRRGPARRVDVSRGGFEAADDFLRESFPDVEPCRMLMGLEFAGHHGHTFAAFLKERGYPVVSVLSTVTKRHKEDEDNSPLKNDQKDAALICKLTGEGKFVTFNHLESPFAELRSLAMQRHRLSVEGVRYRNRLQGLLDVAWPEFVPAFTTIAAPTPLAILQRWPLPADFVAAPRRTVTSVIAVASRGHYSAEKIDALRADAAASVGLTSAADARRQEIRDVHDRWELLRKQMTSADERIAEAVASYPPAAALTTIPELGPVGAATILAELGALEDYVHPRQVLKLAGMNLVGSSSAMREGRRRQSKRGRPLLRKQLFLLAARWCKTRGLFRAPFERMVARNGGSKIKAIAALARKLAPVVLEIARTGQPFDLERWQRERRRGPRSEGGPAVPGPSGADRAGAWEGTH